MLAGGTLSTARPRRTVALLGTAAALPPGRSVAVHLVVPAAALRALRKALGPRHALSASVTVVANSATSKRTVVVRSFAVRR